MSVSRAHTPVKVGAMNLAHRIAMAPMTRFRADDAHVPLAIMKDYYAQRASVPGSLIITEATFISHRAGGYDNIPGIYNDDQIKMWKLVTDAVHQKKSYIVLQLWALGRTADPKVLERDGQRLVSSSPVAMSDNGPVPAALNETEIQQYVQDYAQAARNAIKAGFDGVEIHGANGYLIDQFTQDTCNQRDDDWGGSVEKRARFALTIAKAVADAIGAQRTGIRLSPWSAFQGMRMNEAIPQFGYLAKELAKLRLMYVHLVESRVSGPGDSEGGEHLDFFLEAYRNASPVLVAGGYTPKCIDLALEKTYHGFDVVVAIGRYYTSNPDLVYRLRKGIALRGYEREHFYTPKEPKGYIDYDFSKEWECAEADAAADMQHQIQS